MEPQIQYCRTSERRSIAYFAVGSGPTLIGTSAHPGMTIAKEPDVEQSRRIAELTARNFTYIRYDPHGSGLSDRNDDDLSVKSFVRDLQAVADAAAVTFEDRGSHELKGIAEPQRVYAVRWEAG